MERVHFQQEQMLDELKDLVEKNLFTEVWHSRGYSCYGLAEPLCSPFSKNRR